MVESKRLARQRERQKKNRVVLATASLFLIGLLSGLSVSLYYAWVVNPAAIPSARPAVLREDYQADYIFMVSQSYARQPNLALAQERLARLEDPNIPQTVLNLLESYLRQGQPADYVRQLARLAKDLGAEGSTLALFDAEGNPVSGLTPSPTPLTAGQNITPAVTLLPTPTPPAAPTPTVTPLPTPTFTPQPTATNVPTYRLLAQETNCSQAETAPPLLEVVVVDALLQELPGVEVVVSWEGGENHFFTGFKPEEGPGYADFVMEPEISYTVYLPEGSETVSGLRPEACPAGEGWQGWQLRFQNLVFSAPTPTPTRNR